MSLRVKEIYCGILGEGIHSCFPSLIVRLSGCNLRCSYCDTRYAYKGGRWYSVQSLLNVAKGRNKKMVLITGGEPLLQPEIFFFMEELVDKGYRVLLETNGSIDIGRVDSRVHIIMDLKTPGSGMEPSNQYENIKFLKQKDELKFVLVNHRDYLWAKKLLFDLKLTARCTVNFSPAYRRLSPDKLARWIVKDELDVRLNLQIHKLIFPGGEPRGL